MTVSDASHRSSRSTASPRVSEARHAAPNESATDVSDRRLRAIFDAAFEFVGLLTTDGIVLEANRAALACVGVPAECVIGRPFWETPWWSHSPEEQQRLRDGIARAAAGEFVRFETTHRALGDRLLTMDFSLTPVRDADGRVTMLVPEGRDVTDARRMAERLRESEEMFRLAFEHSAIGMALVGLDGRLRRVNHALCDIVGYSAPELLARSFRDITHPDDVDVDVECMRALRDGARTWYAVEQTYVHKDGSTRDVLLHGAIVRTAAGVPRFVVAQVKDVSARHAAERALEQQRAELARSNAELEQFAYVASHDLQEPLRAVLGYSELLASRYASTFDERGRVYLRHVTDGAERMQALIRDLLMLSRVRTEAASFARVDLGAMVDEVAAELAPVIAAVKAVVTRDALPVVDGDTLQLRQLVQNLVGNALKFSRHGVPPRVHIGVIAAAPNDRCWKFEVRDNGIGIEPRFAERVFVIFQRLHTRDEYPGTGIGLAICRKVVERHGGRIWVEPAPDGGSVFRFTLLRSVPS